MDEEIKKIEDELKALKAIQPVTGSQVPMKIVRSQAYAKTITGSYAGYGEWTFTYRMSEGYHMVFLYAEMFKNSALTQQKDRVSFSNYQMAQDGSGDVKIKVCACYTTMSSGSENVWIRLTAVGDEAGQFI